MTKFALPLVIFLSFLGTTAQAGSFQPSCRRQVETWDINAIANEIAQEKGLGEMEFNFNRTRVYLNDFGPVGKRIHVYVYRSFRGHEHPDAANASLSLFIDADGDPENGIERCRIIDETLIL